MILLQNVSIVVYLQKEQDGNRSVGGRAQIGGQ
jgi:hypothetical protein